MGAKLKIQPATADPFEVGIGNTASIGRTRENTVCLSFCPLVSRQHALIRCHNGWQYQLIDLGSRNGTYVNDERVVMPVTLTDGARIRIADNQMVFVEHDDEPGSDTNAMTMVGSVDHSVVEELATVLTHGALLPEVEEEAAVSQAGVRVANRLHDARERWNGCHNRFRRDRNRARFDD